MKQTKIVLLVILLLSGTFLNAQQESMKFNHLSLKDGLSQTTIFCILQDKKGFMWFGTEDGLNKYDGYGFKIYSHFPNDEQSLSNNSIFSIFEDKNGLIWIGTNGGGLNVFNQISETFSSFTHNPNNTNSISGNIVYTIFQDKKGAIWVGTSSGLDKIIIEDKNAAQSPDYLNKEFRFKHFKSDANDKYSISYARVRSIIQDREGDLWFGTQGGGLNKLIYDYEHEDSPPVFVHYRHDANDPYSLSNDEILTLHEDHTGNLWVGTYGGGLNLFDKKNKKFYRFLHKPADPSSIPHDAVLTIYGEDDNNLWIGTYGGGLSKIMKKPGEPSLENAYAFLNIKNNPLDNQSLSNNSVGAILEDKYGVLWVGTYGGAINKFDTHARKFVLYRHNPLNENSLPVNGVGAIFKDAQGILWVGTSEEGLTRIDEKEGKYQHYFKNSQDKPNELKNNKVTSISEDSNGFLWIGTGGAGLFKMNKETGSLIQYHNIPADPSSLSLGAVRVILEDYEGNLWIGTHGGGLSKLDVNTGKFKNYQKDTSNNKSLFSSLVRALYEDKDGNIWIGNDALSMFNKKTGEFAHYPNVPGDENSLSDNSVRSIYEDSKGNLWIGTLRGGLNMYNKKTRRFTHWRAQEGLPNDVIYGVLGDDHDNIWVSTNSGISMLDVKENKFYNYDINDGLQSNEFSSGAYFKSKNGELFFGGINGFNGFFPDSILNNPYIPDIVITGFQIFNKEVQISNRGETPLNKSISYTDSIIISYKDYIFSFDFAALHYSNTAKNQYAYKMVGLNDNSLFGNRDEEASKHGGWQYVGTRRYVTYTNLDPGEYVFKVKGANNDGLWNEEGTSVHLTIVSPFWRTWWFYLICTLGALAVLYGFIKARDKAMSIKLQNLRDKVSALQKQLQELEEKARISESDKNPFSV